LKCIPRAIISNEYEKYTKVKLQLPQQHSFAIFNHAWCLAAYFTSAQLPKSKAQHETTHKTNYIDKDLSPNNICLLLALPLSDLFIYLLPKQTEFLT
jgi:hypothetical protein